MSNRIVVTVSSVMGIKQYALPLYFRKIIFFIIFMIVSSWIIVGYYIKELHIEVEVLNNKKHTLMQEIDKNSGLALALNDKEIELMMMGQEKDILEDTLSDKIERLIIEKNKIQIAQQFTIEMKNAREESLVQLTNMLGDIENELSKESELNAKLEGKLSLKIKLEKARIQREKEKVQREKEKLQREKDKIEREKERKKRIADKKKTREKKLSRVAKANLGKRYVWGAVGPRTFDCSGFTSSIYKKMGFAIPRVSRNQAKYGKLVPRDKLQVGDLIFFDTSTPRKGYVNHVGIYLGNNKFIHASSAKKRVVISKLTQSFYKKRYKWARRVF